MEWIFRVLFAGGVVCYALYALLLVAFIVLGAYEKLINRNIRIYSGLALTVAAEGRFITGMWPFDESALFSKYTLQEIGSFWIFMIIPIVATLSALIVEIAIFQTIKRRQERRPEFIPRTYGKFNYDFIFLFLLSPVFYFGVMIYAFACGLTP